MASKSSSYQLAEQEHAFRTFRHFPELLKSFTAIEELQKSTGRNLEEYGEFKRTTSSHHKKRSIKRDLKKTSTHKLNELCKSAVDEIHALSDFRQVLVGGRKNVTINKINDIDVTNNTGEFLPTVTITNDKAKASSTNIPLRRWKSFGCPNFVDPLESANAKLAKYSLSFDSRDPVSYLLGFQGAMLDKHEFRTQMRCCLNIRLTDEELEAIFDKMDADGSGMIDGVEFTRYFFMLGNQAREKIYIEMQRKVQKMNRAERDAKLLEEERLKKWEQDQIAQYTEEDARRALEKLTEASKRVDPTSFVTQTMLQGFEKLLTPYEFKQHIEHCFLIKLDPAETGALIKTFACLDGNFSIDGHQFLRKLHGIQTEAWKAHHESRKIFEKRREKVNAMGQRVDYLPKVLGR